MPRWDSMSSVSTDSTHTSKNSSKSLQQSLVTTCVGSTDQLRQLVNKITTLQLNRQVISWSSSAINTLFYFMRCSQVSKLFFFLFIFLLSKTVFCQKVIVSVSCPNHFSHFEGSSETYLTVNFLL